LLNVSCDLAIQYFILKMMSKLIYTINQGVKKYSISK
jgi:hypothetical protein